MGLNGEEKALDSGAESSALVETGSLAKWFYEEKSDSLQIG